MAAVVGPLRDPVRVVVVALPRTSCSLAPVPERRTDQGRGIAETTPRIAKATLVIEETTDAIRLATTDRIDANGTRFARIAFATGRENRGGKYSQDSRLPHQSVKDGGPLNDKK